MVGVHDGVEDQRRRVSGAELLQQRAAERGLARAHFAGELDESLPLPDAVEQMVERLAVLRTVEQEARVGRYVKWRLVQAVIFEIHSRCFPLNGCKSANRAPALAKLPLRAALAARMRGQTDGSSPQDGARLPE